MEVIHALVKAETLHRHVDLWSTPSFITKKEHILSKIPSFLGVSIFLCVIMLTYLKCWDTIYPKCNNVGTILKIEGRVTSGAFSFVNKPALLISWRKQTPPTPQQSDRTCQCLHIHNSPSQRIASSHPWCTLWNHPRRTPGEWLFPEASQHALAAGRKLCLHVPAARATWCPPAYSARQKHLVRLHFQNPRNGVNS